MKRLSIPLLITLVVLSSCGNIQEESDAYGNFEAIDVMVAAESQGKLISFTLQEGQEIKKGELVGVIDTTQYYLKKQQLVSGIRTIQTKVSTVNAQINSIKIQHENLERELKRIESLLKDGAATSKQKDDITGNIDLIASQVSALETQKATIAAERETLQLQIEQVSDQISRGYITNPIDGVVLQKYKEEGEIVGAGQNLYKIADLNVLILRAYISGDQLTQVSIGKDVKVLIDTEGGITELPGRVSWVSAQAEFTPKIIQTREERVNLVYAIKVNVSNDGRLKIGMPAELKF